MHGVSWALLIKRKQNNKLINLSVCLSVCPSIYRSIDLSIYRSIDLSIYLSRLISSHLISSHLISSYLISSIYLSIYFRIDLFLYPSIDRSVHPSIHRSIHPSIHRFIDVHAQRPPWIRPKESYSYILYIHLCVCLVCSLLFRLMIGMQIRWKGRRKGKEYSKVTKNMCISIYYKYMCIYIYIYVFIHERNTYFFMLLQPPNILQFFNINQWDFIPPVLPHLLFNCPHICSRRQHI